jgi:DNA polymerase III sliding clamp (beta) subunit (PCNA family)
MLISLLITPLTLSANESENSGIEVLGFNEEFHIDFNAFLLEALIKNIPTEHFNIHFKTGNAPVMITNTGNEDYTISSILAPLQ